MPIGAGSAASAVYADHLLAWLGIWWVLVLFRTLLDRPRRWIAAFADASYTIYLFHHLIVVLIVIALMPTTLAIGVKFAVVVASTFAATLAIHRLVIRRVPLLLLLFNGRTRR